MENTPGRLHGVRPALKPLMRLSGIWSAFALACGAGATPLAKVAFPATPGGKPCESVIVEFAESPILVTVVPRGSNPQQPAISGASPAVRLIGHDPVSRLGFLERRGSTSTPHGNAWLASANSCIGKPVTAATTNGPMAARIVGWEKQVGGKILPLALLKVDFQDKVPAPGTPLLDAGNRIAGLVFQAATDGTSGYAIPAEAVHRVCRDIRHGGVRVRPRLGFTLNAQDASARVVRVLPGSPAEQAGIRPDDLLLQIGDRDIRAYADVPDAYFYLVPGKPARIVVHRAARRISLSVTPEAAD